MGTSMFIALLGLLSGPVEAAGDVTNGAVVYAKRCSQCHGDEGAADGAAAGHSYPRPRKFAENSTYKIRRTPVGELPTDQDLFDIITLGLGGTSMPPFAVLPEQERWDVVAYIKSLSEDFVDPDYVSTALPIPEVVAAESSPVASSPESVEIGGVLFAENCAKCHGVKGRGDGEQWNTMEEKWTKTRMVPANLANPESYRGGGTAYDIFRTITAGVDGTPMPSHQENLTPEERWGLTHYVMSLHPEFKEFGDDRVVAQRSEAVPETADEEAWAGVPSARFKMIPNIIEPPRNFWTTVEFVSAQAVYDGEHIALRIQWDDRMRSEGTDLVGSYTDHDEEVHWDTEHPDQLALQFAVKKDLAVRPYFMMGDKKRGVNLWWWRSDTDSITEQNGKGFEKITTQDADSTQISGTVTHEDGRYTLYVKRSLSTEDKLDVQFSEGDWVPLAFNIWNGDRGEVGQRRNLTTWYWLFLEPAVPSKAYMMPPFTFLLTLGVLGILVRSTRRRHAPKPEDDNMTATADLTKNQLFLGSNGGRLVLLGIGFAGVCGGIAGILGPGVHMTYLLIALLLTAPTVMFYGVGYSIDDYPKQVLAVLLVVPPIAGSQAAWMGSLDANGGMIGGVVLLVLSLLAFYMAAAGYARYRR